MGERNFWHVGNWCIHTGQKYIESPFLGPTKGVEVLNYAQPFVDALRRIEGAGLGNDAGIESQFADVVDHRCDSQAVDHLWPGIEMLGEGGCEGGDSESMTGQRLVSLPHSVQHAFQHFALLGGPKVSHGNRPRVT